MVYSIKLVYRLGEAVEDPAKTWRTVKTFLKGLFVVALFILAFSMWGMSLVK